METKICIWRITCWIPQNVCLIIHTLLQECKGKIKSYNYCKIIRGLKKEKEGKALELLMGLRVYQKVRFKFLTKTICLIILRTLFQICLNMENIEKYGSYCTFSNIKRVLKVLKEGKNLNHACVEKTCSIIAMMIQQMDPNNIRNLTYFQKKLSIVRFKFLAQDICLIMYLVSGLLQYHGKGPRFLPSSLVWSRSNQWYISKITKWPN